MKFNLASDLHVEFSEAPKFLGGENLILSGDIIPVALLNKKRTDKVSLKIKKYLNSFLEDISKKYKNVFFVMGNHEHYNGVFDYTYSEYREFLSKFPSFKLLEKESFNISDDVVIFGATLWTDFNHGNVNDMLLAKMHMNDYHVIQKFMGATTYGSNYFRLNPENTLAEHLKTMETLSKFCDENKEKKIIVSTHMAPSSKSIDPRYEDHSLNSSYYSDLVNFILDHPQIKVWTHGHTHHSHDYMIGETRVICNPRGYPIGRQGEYENENFQLDFTFEV